MSKKKLRVNSFFAGVGGFDLAFEKSGFKVLFQVEKNEFCKKILKKHWPKIKLFSDINDLDTELIPDAEVWTGGFPCQDVSVARGSKKRDGLKGKNSGLFYPFYDLIKEKKPKVVLIENVTGLLSSHDGKDFKIILESLSKLGYAISWRVLNSRFFGVPQSRPRIFICAVLNRPDIALEILYENKKGLFPKNLRKGFIEIDECQITNAKVAKVAYCLAATSGRHTGTDWSRTYVSYNSSVRRLIPEECEGIQGFPIGWTDLDKQHHKYNGEMDTMRYHALGNAVAVPTVAWISKRIKKIFPSLDSDDKHFVNLSLFPDQESPNKDMMNLHSFPDFDDKSIRKIELEKFDYLERIKWQKGGIIYRSKGYDIKAPEAGSKLIKKDLLDVIHKQIPDDKYFISPNAAIGILRRVDSQNRTLFLPMRNALENMIEKYQAAT